MSLATTMAGKSIRQRILIPTTLLLAVLVVAICWLLLRAQRSGAEKLAASTSAVTEAAAREQAAALAAQLNRQIQDSRDSLRIKAEGLATLVADLSPAPLLTFDAPALKALCQQGSNDRDILECSIKDAKGKPVASFHKPNAAAGASPSQVSAEVRQSGNKIGTVVFVYSLASVEQQEQQIRASYGELQKGVQRISASIDQSVKEQSKTASSEAATLGVGAGIVAVVLGVITAFWISGSVTRPLRQSVQVLESIAEGDLTRTLDLERDDELGQMASALNRAVGEMENAVIGIEKTAHKLANASEQLSATALEQAKGAQTQADQVSLVVTAMQEMSASMAEVSQNSNRAADAARQAAETASQGGSIVETALLKMGSIAESVSLTAGKIQELGKSSDKIGNIVGLIDEIADQTNLLALNAAIEAARAGEQGRGFAVVADEVRKLAERTTTATHEISQMIRTIQAEAATAVSAMQLGTRQVEEGVKSTTQAGESLKEIIQMAERVGEVIRQIVISSDEQSKAAGEVNARTEQISHIALQSATGAKQSAASCQNLSQLAAELQQLVTHFTTRESGQSNLPRDRAAATDTADTETVERAFAQGA